MDRLQAVLADRYTIERQVGSGGMADVFLTHDRRHDRKVAIKVMHRELSEFVGVDGSCGKLRPPPSCSIRISSRSSTPALWTERSSMSCRTSKASRCADG